MGYDIYIFQDRSIAEKFLCAVCQGVAKDVFETDCGHIFCRTCVGKLIRVTSNDAAQAQCPHCRANVTWQNVHGSKFLNREISQLRCKCNLCSVWIGNLSKLSEHHTVDCPDQVIECAWKKYGCKDHKIKRKDMESHNELCKVSHLELKIDCISHCHTRQIQTLKRKYEQQMQSLEKKWKQKLILVHKKYGVTTPNNNARDVNTHISHTQIEQINISSVSTTSTPAIGEVLYHSDGSISYDPNGVVSPLQSGQNRTRRKRKRSVLDECLSNGNGNAKKRVKKRRKFKADGHSGGILNALVTGNNNSNNVLRRSVRTANGRQSGKKGKESASAKRKRVQRRVRSEDNYSESSESGTGSESDTNMN